MCINQNVHKPNLAYNLRNMKFTTGCKQARSIIKLHLLAIILLCPLNGHSEEYQFSYPVTGSNTDELIEQINRNTHSPEGAFGYTKLNTNVGWTAIVDSKGVCEIETVNFSYDITIYMPEWVEKHTAKQCLQDNWDAVWNEIQIHEERHRDLYLLLDTNDIGQRISAIKPKLSCDALKVAVNQEVEAILDMNDILHDQFHASDSTPVLWDC